MANQFAILRDTAHLLVVNKPPNVPFHNTDGSPGAVTLLRAQLGASFPRLYPVHRLDSMSSGALILAKSPEAARDAITAFRDHAVQKYYVAISDRKPSKKQGSVIGDMSRGRRGSWMLQRTATNPSITRFNSVAVDRERQGLRAFLLKPETGKTHQLRVAMKSLGAPVLGDVRYAQADVAKKEERGYLHCAAMRLTVGGEIHQVVCEPTEGYEFLTEGFKSVFHGWFPDGIDKEDGAWFPESKLLRSAMGERRDTRRKFLTEED